MDEPIGRIFDIQRFSIHDGPGIRTTVFMKGCPLRCMWCHNPEGQGHKPLLSFMPDKCIGCGYCFRACPRGAHKMADGKHVLDRSVCEACGTCTRECYAKALELVGRDVTVSEALAVVMRDKPFYETSGGGMTLSGGEPTMQIDFTEALLDAAKREHLHCAVETCGYAQYDAFKRIAPNVDLFLFDIKETDSMRHAELTGVPNDLIHANLRKLHDAGAKILVRLPMIPGINDNEAHFAGIARIARALPNLLGFEIMTYHPLGTSKTARFGLKDNKLVGKKSPPKEIVADWISRLRALDVKIINE